MLRFFTNRLSFHLGLFLDDVLYDESSQSTHGGGLRQVTNLTYQGGANRWFQGDEHRGDEYLDDEQVANI